jgi:hypothetical protein
VFHVHAHVLAAPAAGLDEGSMTGGMPAGKEA